MKIIQLRMHEIKDPYLKWVLDFRYLIFSFLYPHNICENFLFDVLMLLTKFTRGLTLDLILVFPLPIFILHKLLTFNSTNLR